jgi:uncharacterized membrane protein
MYNLALIGRIFFAIALIGLGIEHFVFREFITGRAPKSGSLVWAYISGALRFLPERRRA